MVPRLTVLCAAFAGLLPGPAVTTAMYLSRQEPQPAQAVATALNQTGVSLLALPVAAPEALAVAPCYNNPFLAFARAVLGRRDPPEGEEDDDEDCGEEEQEVEGGCREEGYICCCYHRGCGEEVGCLLSDAKKCPHAHFASEEHIKEGRQPVSFCEESGEAGGEPEGEKKCKEKGKKRKKLKKCGGPPPKVDEEEDVPKVVVEEKVVDVEKDAAVKAAHDALVSGFSSLPRGKDGKIDIDAFKAWGADKIIEWMEKHSMLESAALLLHTGQLKDFLKAANIDLADFWKILEIGIDKLKERDTSDAARRTDPFKAYVQDLHWKKAKEALEKDKGLVKEPDKWKASHIFNVLADKVQRDGKCKAGGIDDAAAVLRRTGKVELAILECQEARVRKHLYKDPRPARDKDKHVLVAAALAGAQGMEEDLERSGVLKILRQEASNARTGKGADARKLFVTQFEDGDGGQAPFTSVKSAVLAMPTARLLKLLVQHVQSKGRCAGGKAQARKELLFFMNVNQAFMSCIVKRKLGDVVWQTDPGTKRTLLRDAIQTYGKDADAMCSDDVFADQVKQACGDDLVGVSLAAAPCNKCCKERGDDYETDGSKCWRKTEHDGKRRGTALRALRGLWRWGAAK